MNLIGILQDILNIKERFIRCIYGEKTESKSVKKHRSMTFTKNETLFLNSATKLRAKKTTQEAKFILKKYVENPDGLLDFIKANGTPVVKAKYLRNILTLLGEGEGFVFPLKGMKAFILSFAINILSSSKVGIGFKTPAMFVYEATPSSIFLLAHQFHHWMAYKEGLPGYDDKVVQSFKYMCACGFDDKDINKLTLDDIIALKDSIARDIEAIDFVKEISRELVGSKDSLKRLKNGEKLSL